MSTTPAVVPLPGNEPFARAVAASLGGRLATASVHRFPDGETRVATDAGPDPGPGVVVCSLFRPNEVLVPLLFLAALLRERGARPVVLLAPYLAYMRQDQAFHPGEGVSARYFARLLDGCFDGLVTVDPHLHRIASLDLLFARPARAVAAAPAIAAWLAETVRDPLLVGPDSESVQWVAGLAAGCGAPHVVMSKERHGDRSVSIQAPDLESFKGRTPVIVDDIIASGGTMIEAVRRVREAGLAPPVCIGVHGIFAGDCMERLQGSGAARIITCNTIPHSSNAIDVAPQAAAATRELLDTLAD